MKTIKIAIQSVKDIIAKINIDCIKKIYTGDDNNINITGTNLHIIISDDYIEFNNTEIGKICAKTIADVLNTIISFNGNNYSIPFSNEDYEISVNAGDIIVYKLYKKIIKNTIE